MALYKEKFNCGNTHFGPRNVDFWTKLFGHGYSVGCKENSPPGIGNIFCRSFLKINMNNFDACKYIIVWRGSYKLSTDQKAMSEK